MTPPVCASIGLAIPLPTTGLIDPDALEAKVAVALSAVRIMLNGVDLVWW